jgi:protein-tyrosine phosphatase
MEIFWVEDHANTSYARLAIVLRPRGDQALPDELLHIRDSGIKTVVSMLEHWEADYLGLEDEGKLAERIGLNFLSYPIPDGAVPRDKASFRRFIHGLAARVYSGEAVGMHCRGSIGRSTIAVACTLIQLGWDPETALHAIEFSRGCSVPDTEEQRDWILRYEAEP